MPLRPRRPATALRHAAGVVLVLAVLWAQALGQWHRVLHAPGLADASPSSVVHRDPHSASDGHGWREWLFGGEHHGSTCVLYDQLAHADGLPGLPTLWLPPVWVAAVPPWEGRWQIAAQAVGFLARGPPRVA